MSAEEFARLSVKYDELQWEPMPDMKPGRLDASDVLRWVSSLPGEPGPYAPVDVMAKEPDEVDITEGSLVWRLKPHQKIGEVDHVIFDDTTRKTMALVIRRGFLFEHEVVLPVRFIVEIVEALEGIVRVEMTDEDLAALEPYATAHQ